MNDTTKPANSTKSRASIKTFTLPGGVAITHPDDVAFVQSLTEADVIRLGQMFYRCYSPLQWQMFDVHQDNVRSRREQKRQYPDHRLIPLATVRQMLKRMLPRVISYQAVWAWCADGIIKAEQINGSWYFEPDSFLSHWEIKGLPSLQCPLN